MLKAPIALMTAGIVGLAACQAAPKADITSTQMVIDLSDYRVTPNLQTLKAGKAKIGVRNTAGMVHEVVLLKTDTAADKLQVDGGSAKAKEEGTKVASVLNLGSGGVAAMDVDLTPGSYVLICNIAGHYQLGMRSAFKVE